ncbi:MAG: PEP-utilizing enzyme, partial [Alphaproteobacteria bacterium]|nr:PEP-utilizing enzyme [Alphaproteobacteria bacterium]
SAEEAEEKAAEGINVVLCRVETSPEDITGMHASKGVITAKGGMTSHAAVVARSMGCPCVAGAGEISIDYAGRKITVNGTVINAGEVITIDGGTGEVMAGEVATLEPELTGDFGTLMGWADEIRTLKVRTNAETPVDAATARKFGAEGIGLARTEHMFFDAERIIAVREMILAEDLEGRKAALAKLLPMQKADFVELFKIMEGLPVTIRLLDPPLHEFLPHTDAEQAELASVMGVDVSVVKAKMEQLHESNPMLGHRGCRLGVTYPEISEMQARAIFTAAADVMKETGSTIIPEVMVPLVSMTGEFETIKAVVDAVAKEVMTETGTEFEYLVGTMIELPRAALMADKIAEAGAEFFSFGTNDLTQTTFGISRDDAGMFLPEYKEKKVIAKDPFVALDQDGVGQLVAMGKEKGRSVREGMKVGICGEHGGEPSSIDFCHRTGLTYVSCSPFRVPIARLAAAHATLKNKK